MVKVNKNRKIDLILITPGSQGEQDKHHIPLGILYVGSMLKRNNFDVQLHHILPAEIDETVKDICERKPLFVGFSVLSGMTTYWTVVTSEKIKKREPTIKIVWGGHHPTFTAEECLKEDYIDIVVRGEGEITSLELATLLMEDEIENLHHVKGVSYKDKTGYVFHNPDRNLIKDLDSLLLDFELLNMAYYIGKDKVKNLSFFSSRGCPFNCAFCSTPKFSGKFYRCHSERYVLEQLRRSKKAYGINSVFFSDDNFYLNKKRAMFIITEMLKMGVSCDTLDVRLDGLVDDDLKFLKKFKVRGIFWGWESGNNRLLKLMRKNISVEDILEKAEMIARYEIPCWGSGIMLLPTETFDETITTIRFSVKLRKILKGSTIGLFRFMALPATNLTEIAIRDGFQVPISQKDWRKIDPLEPFYKPEWVFWYNDAIDCQLRWVQEISRTSLSVIFPNNSIKFMINNVFSKVMNRSMNKLSFSKSDVLIRNIYKMLKLFYSWIMRKKTLAHSTRILAG